MLERSQKKKDLLKNIMKIGLLKSLASKHISLSFLSILHTALCRNDSFHSSNTRQIVLLMSMSLYTRLEEESFIVWPSQHIEKPTCPCKHDDWFDVDVEGVPLRCAFLRQQKQTF